MAMPEQQPLDITDMPELARVADEVCATQRPRILCRGDREIAMLVPLAYAVITPVPYNPALAAVLAGLDPDDPVARTAGILHTDQPFPGHDQEEELASIAIAADIVAEWER